VLILGVTLPALAAKLAEYDIITALPSLEYAKRLSAAAVAAGVKVRAHVKLDTGMNRLGFAAYGEDFAENTVREIEECVKLRGISVEGMFTHFAEADDSDSPELVGANEKQAERFFLVSKLLESRGIKIPFRHMCNSAAALRFPKLALDGVRLGISLYGSRPSEFFNMPLKPVMALKTKISHIHTLPAGEKVSYGGKFSSDNERVLATLPIGYADGFLRAYGGARVAIHAEGGDFDAPIAGRICMDQCIVDITDGMSAAPKVGDEVTLFGDTQERLYSIAESAGTIPYEVLCAVSSRVIRLYI
jgi:alanine racemase